MIELYGQLCIEQENGHRYFLTADPDQVALDTSTFRAAWFLARTVRNTKHPVFMRLRTILQGDVQQPVRMSIQGKPVATLTASRDKVRIRYHYLNLIRSFLLNH